MALPFIEIIESVSPHSNMLMWKFADADKEIKNGAMLTVRESQQALLLNEGQLADVFSAGKHRLETENIPILSRLKGWKYGFESPFKADVYFFNTHQFVNLRWGTPSPILMRDENFGQVRIRAFGNYNIRINDIGLFFKEYAGTYPSLGIAELELQLRDFIAPKFAEVLTQAKIAVVDVAGNISELNQKISPLVQSFFSGFGIEITQFTVTSVTLPEEVLKYYDKVTGMNMVTDINKFSQFSIANAMDKDNSEMADLTRQGLAMGMIMNMTPNGVPLNKPLPGEDILGRLKNLKELFSMELITEAEYAAKKEELLKLL
ncbi:SPFH domain-containing protein [Pedobacter caeni]|uniref:Membrane protease subunit, stomatin/prohibitin family, contains C-terminal Zn-ribbon domain n=1 Tax=Pedobacter caeni TaxID=288992 RepID=A0A1M4W2M3_9SPHI|nr:SPFH domain-containing protein [Pedobacter caeni]SHE75447.1 Membrane protease subunit, stomatin/prohibitin family, contains C-terminal Zn-ribbon domain [Pedobacter caeni]